MRLLSFAIAFLAGVLIASRYESPLSAIGLFIIASTLLAALLMSTRRSTRPALLMIVLLLGTLRGEAFDGGVASGLSPYHSRLPIQVEGVVVSDPEPAGAFTRLRLRAEKVNSGGEWLDARGDVLVTLRESTDMVQRRERPFFRYGDRLLLNGTLKAPPVLEDFDYPAYLARQGIGSVMPFPGVTLINEGEGVAFYRWLYGLRWRIAESLARTVSEPQASVGQALLLGLRDNLPDGLVEDFRVTGTSHVLAISGLHVGILLGISLAISQGILGRRRHFYLLAPLVLMWLHALLSGMSPSATRACIMGTIYLAALLFGRPRNVLPALGFAAAIMVAVSPDVLWSVSFQLSFAAMAGIALLAEPVSQRIQSLFSQAAPGAISSALSDMVAMTVAATVATLPLVAFYFQRVSLVGLPTTLLTLPALPAVLVTQAMAGLVGLLNATIAIPFGWLAWTTTAYVTGVVGLVARLPGIALDTGATGSGLVLAYYGILIALYALTRTSLFRPAPGWPSFSPRLPRSSPISRRGVPTWILVSFIAVAALVWIAALTRPDQRLHVAFVDVGQGDTAFIITPGGQQILVDGGPDPQEFVQFVGERMPFYDRTIEVVVLTHAHSDHVTGLVEVLNRYEVEYILEREMEYDSPPYQEWRKAVEREGAEVIQAQAGQVVAIDEGVFIQVLNPPARLFRGTASDVDNASVVLRLVYGNVSFLLTGDVFSEAERAIVASDAAIDSDVLKVAHHGSRSSSSAEFINKVGPAIAVISSGENNRFGHPHAETLQTLRKHVPEDRLFFTEDRGTIEFISDGKRLEAKTER